MKSLQHRRTQKWGSRVGLIMAMAGNAVGMGNFLRFPVQALQNGGGAFIVPYLVCFVLMGIPLLWIEWALGRMGGKGGHHSTPFIMHAAHKWPIWKYFGVFGIFTNIAVAAYYCYLESWTLNYIFHGVAGTFRSMPKEDVATYFDSYVSLTNPSPIVFWIICLVLNTWILSRGLKKGVELAAKVGMPLLILFGILLAVRGVTLQAGEDGAIFPGVEGLNFLWTPNFSTIWSAKVWLAAAGQVFFTLSVGMGSIQCYASYLKETDDIALNAMSAGWMNEFVEVVLGGAILIPISVGYLGIDKVIEITKTGALGLGFKTFPYLFEQWGPVMGTLSYIFWFGLLFFAGITSSLAMGTPLMGFLEDEFKFHRSTAALVFGTLILLLGLPTVLYFNQGVFDEFDFWAGTFSLVIFALAETILFAWILPDQIGWLEINKGADIKIPIVFKYIIKYITPVILTFVFISSLPDIFDKLTHQSLNAQIAIADGTIAAQLEVNKTYLNYARLLLLLLFIGISLLVHKAYVKRKRSMSIT